MTEVSKLRSDIRDAIDANMIGGSDEHPTISTDGLVGDLVELFHSPPRSPTGEAMSASTFFGVAVAVVYLAVVGLFLLGVFAP